MKDFYLEILHVDKNSNARYGILHTPHGDCEVPMFMPVGTLATVKTLSPQDLKDVHAGVILANTYHLSLRPGEDIVKEAGGLHKFMNYDGPILTDSGGFQVFSLAPFRKITSEGVTFRSHRDGSRHLLTPESVVDIQRRFNSDIQMQLDVCTGYDIPEKKAREALTVTSGWALRAKDAWQQARDTGYQGALFPIVQGNFYRHLRKESAEFVASLDMPGIAIGGLSVGEPAEVFAEMLAYTADLLPRDKPRYVMGIGTPEYILEAVENGIDMFDCVLPTRNARNGSYFTRSGCISIKNACYSEDFRPVDPECSCKVCRQYSRAYLRHLFKEQEILSSMLATYHNLAFMNQLMLDARAAIRENRFPAFRRAFNERYFRSGTKG